MSVEWARRGEGREKWNESFAATDDGVGEKCKKTFLFLPFLLDPVLHTFLG